MRARKRGPRQNTRVHAPVDYGSLSKSPFRVTIFDGGFGEHAGGAPFRRVRARCLLSAGHGLPSRAGTVHRTPPGMSLDRQGWPASTAPDGPAAATPEMPG